MPPKKKKRIKKEHMEELGIFEDDEDYQDEEVDEKELWRDVV
jgi:hypothetical protein